MVFPISFPFLPILVTYFVIGTENVLQKFSVFSPRQLNSLSNSFACSLWSSDNPSSIHCEKLQEYP